MSPMIPKPPPRMTIPASAPEIKPTKSQAITPPGHIVRAAKMTIEIASPSRTIDRVIEHGDAVVVDIGGTMPDGYCSDETRTFAIQGGFADVTPESFTILAEGAVEA